MQNQFLSFSNKRDSTHSFFGIPGYLRESGSGGLRRSSLYRSGNLCTALRRLSIVNLRISRICRFRGIQAIIDQFRLLICFILFLRFYIVPRGECKPLWKKNWKYSTIFILIIILINFSLIIF